MTKEVTIEELGFLLAKAQKNTIIEVRSRNENNGLNKKALDGSGLINPHYKADSLIKTSTTTGRINFDWTAERQIDTQDREYKPTKSHGEKINGLTITPKGPAISMIGAKTTDVSYYLDGMELSKDEYKEVVAPFKPPTNPKGDSDTDNVRLLYIKNIYWVKIDGVIYTIK